MRRIGHARRRGRLRRRVGHMARSHRAVRCGTRVSGVELGAAELGALVQLTRRAVRVGATLLRPRRRSRSRLPPARGPESGGRLGLEGRERTQASLEGGDRTRSCRRRRASDRAGAQICHGRRAGPQAQAEPSPVGIEATEAQKEVANPAPLEPWTEAHRVAPRSKSSRAKGEPRTEQPEAIRPDPKRPACVVVDDDDLVQMAVAMQIESIGAHEVQALGATLEEQLRMEDVIMGVRRAEDLDVELPLPHTPAEVAVIDLNLSLPPPWPPHLQAQRADGRPLLPEDGLDLARRLRARGFEGKLFLHTAESRDSLEALRRQHIEIDDVFEKSSALRFKQEFKEALAL